MLQHGSGTVTLVENSSNLKWYSFKLVVNTDTRKYSVQVYDGSKLISEAVDLDFGISSGVQASGIRNINVFLPDQAVDKTVYIDNVKAYIPQVASISVYQAGNGLQIPKQDSTQLKLTARAYNEQNMIIPGSSFKWALKEQYPGLEIEAIVDEADSAWLKADLVLSPE